MSQSEINNALYGDSRKSKYGVDLSARGKENRTHENIVYHSRHEMECYRDWIVPQVNVGLLINLQRQVPFELHAVTPGGFKVKVGTYVADWVANDKDGNVCVFEAKGRITALYSRTRKHFEAEYGMRIREL